MDVTVVLPTMKRTSNGYSYLRQSIAHNKKLLNTSPLISNRFVYFSKEDLSEISRISGLRKFEHILRPTHERLKGVDRTSYAYWRMHLCLDFAASMQHAMSASPSKYFMWLEDDTLLTANFELELIQLIATNKKLHMASAYHTDAFGGCAACLILERQSLIEYVDLIEQRYLEDIPLDHFYEYHSRKISPFRNKAALHIGKHSSRSDSVCIREEEFPTRLAKYKSLLLAKLHLLNR